MGRETEKGRGSYPYTYKTYYIENHNNNVKNPLHSLNGDMKLRFSLCTLEFTSLQKSELNIRRNDNTE